MRATTIAVACIVITCFVASTADATSSPPYPIDIRQAGNVPAACLPGDFGYTVEIERADVFDALSQTYSPEFEWTLERLPGSKPLRLKPGECVVFRNPVTGYQQSGELQLKEGETYFFRLLALSDPRKSFIFRHVGLRGVGKFCVIREPDRQLRFLAYIDHANNTTTYPACARYRISSWPAPDGIAPPDPPR